jgi:hypothetical protein
MEVKRCLVLTTYYILRMRERQTHFIPSKQLHEVSLDRLFLRLSSGLIAPTTRQQRGEETHDETH